jgi:archaellum component FlaG (FlaF/FlaG flagellin family)
MKNRRITKMSMSALVLLISSLLGNAQAAEILVDSSILDQAMDVVADKYSESAEAQEEITRLANSASSTFEEFKRANDNLESLLVLNAGYRRQIAAQEQQLETLAESIDSVEEVTREIPLLMEKMLSALEQFVAMDYPFHVDTRTNRLQFARNAIDNPDVSIAEKFRQVLVAYQTETSYGRTFETYADTININGSDRDVNIARFGRVALIYQTTDRQETGAWDNEARQWVSLSPGEYRTAVQTAIRVASQLDAPRIINLPVAAPEAAQ